MRLRNGSAVLEGGRSADIHEFCFQAAKLSEMDCAELQGAYLLKVRNGTFRLRNVQIWAMPSCKDFDLLKLKNCVLQVGNVQI